MPQPAITGVPLTCKFGSLPLPNGQGNMTQVNLNDLAKWFWQDFAFDDDFIQLTPAQLAWRGRGVVVGRDRGPRVLSLPMRFVEASAGDFGAAKAVLTEAGQQQLTFDNSTAIVANLRAIKGEQLVKRYAPYQWDCTLEFFCPEPVFRDISATTLSPQALTSGSPTAFNVTYAGSVFTEPVWTLTIPVGNTAPIASFVLANTMSGEGLTILFPGNLAGSTAWTITIDAAAQTVSNAAGTQFDFSGSFPLLHGPTGQVNAMNATLTPASSTATSCTIGASYRPRWLI